MNAFQIANRLEALVRELRAVRPRLLLRAAILDALAQGPASGSALARGLRRRYGATLAVCRALEAEGLIARTPGAWALAQGSPTQAAEPQHPGAAIQRDREPCAPARE